MDEAWSVTGPPALCVMFACPGLFGEPFDLVVAGINPGANVGPSVYHSGTVGAALTARSRGISGVAVSQAVTGFGVEGQGWDEMLAGQKWHSAAVVAEVVVGGLIAQMPAQPVVLNVNVPNVKPDQIVGWRRADVGTLPQRAMAVARMEPMVGHEGAYSVKMTGATRSTCRSRPMWAPWTPMRCRSPISLASRPTAWRRTVRQRRSSISGYSSVEATG